MGLAASQARLLTLTSRLSSIELKQQMIANAKILLANDSEEVSTKYTKALNNQTLKMSDGTNEIPMTYDNLKSFGYDVKRTGDGLMAGETSYPKSSEKVFSSGDVLSIPVVQKPSQPRPSSTQLNPPIKTVYENVVFDSVAIADSLSILNGTNDYGKWMTTRGSTLPSQASQLAVIANKVGAFSANASKINAFKAEVSKVGIVYTTKNNASYYSANNINALYSKFYDVKSSLSKDVDTYNNSLPAKNKAANEDYQRKCQAHDEAVNLKKQWDEYDSYLDKLEKAKLNTQDGTSSVGGAGGAGASAGASGSSSNPQAQALAQQLKSNPQFLIQGLLSGYLTLVKDGQDVSLSSATNILEQYDKSDDAAAEAEYNAQMAKINRKEKVLDNQMKSLDTEHSAMQQEIESVKSIISKHAENDFNLFG